MALKMVKIADRGSMGSAQSREGRTALAASKLIVASFVWASLDVGSSMVLYHLISAPVDTFSTLAPFLPFFLLQYFLADTTSLLLIVIILSKPILLVYLGANHAQSIGRWAPLAAICHKHSHPSPLLVQLNHFRYANIWTYGI